MARTFSGYVDAVTADGWLEGWVIDDENPGAPVDLGVQVGGELVASGRADNQRADVAKAGFATEVCGFHIRLPASVLDGRPRDLSFRIGDAVVRLGGVETVQVVMHGDAPPPPAAAAGRTEAHFDYVRGGRICGWSLDLVTLEPLPVQVFCDGLAVAEVACERFRGDLFNAFGAHGGSFDVELPAWVYDGRAHVIAVRRNGEDVIGSPRTLTVDEQRLHWCLGAFRTNTLTQAGLGAGFAEDMLLTVLTPGANLSTASRGAAQALPVDALMHAAVGGGVEQLAKTAISLLDANALSPAASAAASSLVDVAQTCARPVRDALRARLAACDADAAAGAAVVLAACDLADDDAEGAWDRLTAATQAGELAETWLRLGADALLRAGQGDRAAHFLQRGLANVVDA